MSKEELPSIEDLLDENLPSVEDFIEGDDNLPSVEKVVENNNLSSVEDIKEDNDLPSVEDYIEEETVTIEDADGNTFAEVEDIIPPWPELLKIINDVREEIPDIPEIKYYDAELEKLCEIVDEIRSEIPEVKYYDAEVEAICEQIDLVRNTISELPEVKYYDEQIDSIESRISVIKEDIINLPEPKYYDNDLQSIREDIESFKKNFPWIPWIEESFENVNDSIGTVEEKISLELDSILESVDVKVFENKVLINEVKDNFTEDKQQILADIKESSQKIFDLHNEFKDDDRKLKKQIQGEYNKLKKSVQEQLEKYNQESVKTDELLLKYFTDLKEEISKSPEVKYYDDDIDTLHESLKKSNKRFLPIESDIKSLYKIVEDIKKTQQELNEQKSLEVKQDVSEDKDPLTPTDQKFATLDDLSKHYSLFVNRIQQQIATIGGGGETRLRYLDDIVGIATNLSAYDGMYLGIDASNSAQPFVFSSVSGGTGAGGTWSNYDSNTGVTTTKKVKIQNNLEVTGVTTSTGGFVGNLTGTATGLSDTPDITIRNITGVAATFTGVLTYEDVTSIDSVGLVTARQGINVDGGQIIVGSAFSVGQAGVVTASSAIVGSAVTINSSGLNVLGVVTATTFDGNLAFSNITGISTDIVGDTSPQLGGNLDLNSNDITGTGNINVSGITTISTGIGTVHIGTGSTTLLVDGDARVTGILTIGQGSITLDPNAKKISGIDEIIVGTATTVSIKQNNQGDITFEKEDGEEASVGIGTTVSINTTGIITAATLKASTAFYPPIYTTAQRDAGSFNEGAMIYNSTTKKMEFYNGTSWTSLPGMSLGLTVALDG